MCVNECRTITQSAVHCHCCRGMWLLLEYLCTETITAFRSLVHIRALFSYGRQLQ